MKPIPISSCEKCSPKSWIVEIVRDKAIYKCNKCHELTESILRRRNYHEEAD